MLDVSSIPSYPVLPLRDIVVFPHMIVPLFVGREKSVAALETVMKDDKQILLVAQKNASQDDPAPKDIHTVGVVGSVLQLLKLPDGTVKVLVEGGARARIVEFRENPAFFEARAEKMEEDEVDPGELEALSRSVANQFEQYVKLNKKVPPEVLVSVNQIEEPGKLADTIASHLSIKLEEKQELLEIDSVGGRLERVISLMEGEIGVLQVEKRIRSRVKRQMEKTQREYYLNEQMKAIQKELGEGEDGRDEAAEFEARIKATKLTKEAREKALAEVKKLRSMSPMSAEATVVRNYLDWILSIPWKKRTRIKKDIKNAEKILNDDHYGLEKVKERILEYLAVQQRARKMKGPILCLVGPPGVGKTSLGKSVARATGRNFVRFSLGGVRDEAEIRGHRRTYIGSLPGKIIQSMKKAKSSNPLFLLDEVDKMGADFRGDPASALLEVLDPEQNNTFNDHYLEVDYDLSDVMFITTANTLRMAPALLDRMETIRIPGYTEHEKIQIAKRHLIPKQAKAHALKKGEWSISDEALTDLIRYYTREAGVRNLERELANLARKATREIVADGREKVRVTRRNPQEICRHPQVPLRRGRARGHGGRHDRPRLDRGRRRASLHRVGNAAGQGPGDFHRQARRRHARIGSGRRELREVAGGAVRHQADHPQQARHPRSRAGRRDAKGRSLRRCRHGDLHRLGAHGRPGQEVDRHDRRDHAARPRAADRRPQGEDACGVARRAHDGPDPEGEREGPRRHSGQCEEGHHHRLGRIDGRHPEARARSRRSCPSNGPTRTRRRSTGSPLRTTTRT